VLKKLAAVYHDQPEQVATAADSLAAGAEEPRRRGARASCPPRSRVRRRGGHLPRRYDARFGGLRQSRKFPSDLPIRFLLRYQQRRDGAQALAMATQTLAQMAAGGIHDQSGGGGFHRYATDPEWLVPHFEKMLYDNAARARLPRGLPGHRPRDFAAWRATSCATPTAT
jgi:uncharacterized protein YyaL (SSP411 family)